MEFYFRTIIRKHCRTPVLTNQIFTVVNILKKKKSVQAIVVKYQKYVLRYCLKLIALRKSSTLPKDGISCI